MIAIKNITMESYTTNLIRLACAQSVNTKSKTLQLRKLHDSGNFINYNDCTSDDIPWLYGTAFYRLVAHFAPF